MNNADSSKGKGLSLRRRQADKDVRSGRESVVVSFRILRKGAEWKRSFRPRSCAVGPVIAC